MNKATEGALTIAISIIGLATLAIIISKKSQSIGVINSVFTGFNNALGTAISPLKENF